MNTNITLAQEWIAQADAILIGASNGLSIAEGYHIYDLLNSGAKVSK